MLVHVHGHLHLETPPIEPYMVTTLPFKNVIETLTRTYKLLCALAKQISTMFETRSLWSALFAKSSNNARKALH